MMEQIPTSVSVIRCNSERQGNLKISGDTVHSKSTVQEEKSSRHDKSEVMVECVSSTTEHSLLTAHREPLFPSRCASLYKAPLSQQQRNQEKHMHSKIYENGNASKLKPDKLSRSSPSRERDRDRKMEKQHQDTLSASISDKTSHAQSSMKCIPKTNTVLHSEISSSSLVLQSRRSYLSSSADIRPGSSTYARRSSDSYSKYDPKSHSTHEKYAQSSRDFSTSRKDAFQEKSDHDAKRQKHHWQNAGMDSKRKSQNESSSSFESSKNREPNTYKEMIKNKIRNNIEKMNSKEMIEKQIRNNLEKMSKDFSKSSVDSEETVMESTSKKKKVPTATLR